MNFCFTFEETTAKSNANNKSKGRLQRATKFRM